MWDQNETFDEVEFLKRKQSIWKEKADVFEGTANAVRKKLKLKKVFEIAGLELHEAQQRIANVEGRNCWIITLRI